MDHDSPRSFVISEIIVIVIMPFLYGAATRLPFIYFVIHLSDHFELDWLPIGLSVAAYQGCRVITSAFSIHCPNMSHVFGTSVGLAGYITVFLCDKDSLAPFVAGTAVVGMSETMSSMQKYSKEMYKHHPDRKKTRLRMKYQYAFVMIGVMFSFFIGGFTYQYFNINGVAVFGIILEGLALLAFFLFQQLPRKAVKEGTSISTSVVQEVEKVTFPIKVPNQSSIVNDGGEEIDDVEGSHVVDSEKSTSKKKRSSAVTFNFTLEQNKYQDHQEQEEFLEEKDHDDIEKENGITPDQHLLVTDHQETNAETNVVDGLNITRSSNVKTVKEEGKKEEKDETDKSRKSFISSRRRSTISFMKRSITRRFSSLINKAHSEYTICDLPATWINWLLCCTFGVEALTIGYTLGIGPIFILNEFNKGTDIIGIFFSIGAAFGSISAILITCTSFGSRLMRSIVAPPFDLCFAMGGIALGVFIACIPTFTVHVIGLIVLMCFNDLGATIMTELQSSITTVSNFSLLGPLGQVIRRTLNVVTALTGPILFGINPRFPYYVAGSATLCWTIMLFILFKLRLEKTVEVISDITGRREESVRFRMSFATNEQVYSMAAVNHKRSSQK